MPPTTDRDYYGLLRRATLAAAEAASLRDAVHGCLGPLSAELGWPVTHVLAPSPEDHDRWVSVGVWLDPDQSRFDALRGVLEGASGIGRVGPAARAAETGLPQWQVHLTPPPPDAREATFHPLEAAADLGLGAALAFPVLLQGSVVAVVEVFTVAPASPDSRVVELMDAVTRLLAGVAERQRASLAAQTKEEQLRRLLGTSAALVTVDRRGAVQWSPQLQRLLGWTADEAMRRDISELLLTADDEASLGPALWELVEQASETSQVAVLDLPVRHRDGRVLAVEISVWAAAHGRTTLLLRDVTERRNAQQVIHAVNDTMRRAFVDAPIGMAVMSRDGDFLDVNSSLCQMLGYDPSQLAALTLQQVTDAADVAATVEHLRRLKAGK